MSFFRNTNLSTEQLANSTPGPIKLTKGSGPATDRGSIPSVDLAKKFDKAGISLSKRGLDGIRAEAVMLLDHSGSMSNDYRNGTVQKLVERSLGFALQIDADGKIPVIRFDTFVKPAVEVDVTNYQEATQHLYHAYDMGSTNLTAALKHLLDLAKQATSPIFAIIVTDGEPNNTHTATEVVKELADYAVFLKFLAIQPVSYLQELDDMGDRRIDNADAKFITDPSGMSDLEFAEAMADEWDTWITAATNVGIIS